MANGEHTPHNGGITYTVKEILFKLEHKIDAIDEKLDRKVDRDDFTKIALRVEAAADRAAVLALEGSFNNLVAQIQAQDKVNLALAKQAQATQEQSEVKFTKREKMLGVVVTLIALSIQIWVVTGGIN